MEMTLMRLQVKKTVHGTKFHEQQIWFCDGDTWNRRKECECAPITVWKKKHHFGNRHKAKCGLIKWFDVKEA